MDEIEAIAQANPPATKLNGRSVFTSTIEEEFGESEDDTLSYNDEFEDPSSDDNGETGSRHISPPNADYKNNCVVIDEDVEAILTEKGPNEVFELNGMFALFVTSTPSSKHRRWY